MPLHSVEAPLPAFSFGKLFYRFRPDASSQSGLRRTAAELADALAADWTPLECAKLLEIYLHTAPEIGPAADIYALGAIFYQMLTGRPPFRAATVLQTLEQVKSAEPVPPSRLQPGLPRDADTIALKCLEKDPRRRYRSADELGADLRRFVAGEPVRARPVPARA